MAKSPDAFRTISEVAKWIGTQAHVLRFWESKFDCIAPVKRAGGRRYYRPQDMLIIGGIKQLLHEEGMTIKGVQKLIETKGIDHVSALSPALVFEEKKKKPRKQSKKPKTPKTQQADAPSAPVEDPQKAAEPSNVVAFTINPLPKPRPKKKASREDPDQPLLFPEISEWSPDDVESAQDLTPKIKEIPIERPSRVTKPAAPRAEHSDIQPVFKSIIRDADVRNNPSPLPALGVGIKAESSIKDFTPQPAYISKILSMTARQKKAFISANYGQLVTMWQKLHASG